MRGYKPARESRRTYRNDSEYWYDKRQRNKQRNIAKRGSGVPMQPGGALVTERREPWKRTKDRNRS